MAKKRASKDILAVLNKAGLEPTVHSLEGLEPEALEPDGLPPTVAISSPLLTKRQITKSVDRVPPEVDGIQVNFCKNPACGNYGVPALNVRPGKDTIGVPGSQYTISGAGTGGGTPVLVCKICGETPTIKSNKGIAEELARLSAYLEETEASCPDTRCANHGVPLSAGTAHYYNKGKTPAGSERYQCRACSKSFSIGAPTRRQKAPHKNRDVMVLLMNKAPFRRACETADINISTLYDKIDFIYRQCLAFVADRERELVQGKALPKMYIAVDRQDYTVNWNERGDKRNVTLHAVGSADLTSSYVFGMHLNFDPSLKAALIEEDAIAIGDADYSAPFRQYARLWLPHDYAESVMRSATRPSRGKRGKVAEDIQAEYADTADRTDTEISEQKTLEEKLPSRGMQTHAEYTLYAHFLFLRKLLPGAEKYRFFLDQDSGIRAACLAAFHREITARIADAFYVRIAKDLSTGKKLKAVNTSLKVFRAFAAKYPELTESKVKALMMRAELERCVAYGKWQDKWAYHPLPSPSEPEKALCYLTDLGGLNPTHKEGLTKDEIEEEEQNHKANLFLKGSLHAIDRYFQVVRRRISMLERPISSANAAGNRWYGYAAYQPEVIVKLLAIHRVFYNYCRKGDDKQTPAMRLGLAKAVVDPQTILYFR